MSYKIRYKKKGQRKITDFTGSGQYKRIVYYKGKKVAEDDEFYNFVSEANVTKAVSKFKLPRFVYRDKKGQFTKHVRGKDFASVDVYQNKLRIFKKKKNLKFFEDYFSEDTTLFFPNKEGLISHLNFHIIVSGYVADIPHIRTVELLRPVTGDEVLDKIDILKIQLEQNYEIIDYKVERYMKVVGYYFEKD